GHDRFPEELMRRYFSDAPSWVGVPWERFFALGQAEDDAGSFNMTYLAMSFAGYVNGVSRLHGHVSRRLLHPFGQKLPPSGVPVRSITNGVHLPTWTDPAVAELLSVSARPVTGEDFARGAASLDPAALWGARAAAKRRLIEVVRARLEGSFRAR